MALTQAEADALRAAIAAGVKSIAYSDRRVEYHPLADMLKALEIVEAEVSQSTEGRSTLATFSRG